MAIEKFICDWVECPIAASFHIEVPPQHARHLNGQGGLRLPFGHTHHNVCGAHMDEYSLMRQPKAIYSIGRCPHCNVI